MQTKLTKTSDPHLGWLSRMVRLFRKAAPTPKRTVMLVMYDGKLVIATATETQSGWIARWTKNDYQWSRLIAGGKTVGTELVKGWYPHSGWAGNERHFSA